MIQNTSSQNTTTDLVHGLVLCFGVIYILHPFTRGYIYKCQMYVTYFIFVEYLSILLRRLKSSGTYLCIYLQTTQHNTPEDLNLQQRRCENLKSRHYSKVGSVP